MAPTFIDLAGPKLNVAYGYANTNEEPHLYNKMLGSRRFKKSGGISSSGEVALCCLIPRSEQVFTIDHSYSSLFNAYLRALMVRNVGAKLRHMLVAEKWEDVSKVAQECFDEIPAGLRKHVGTKKESLGALVDDYYRHKIPNHIWMQLRKDLYYVNDANLKAAAAGLDRLTMIHGDISDLGQYGPLDLLYVSNCTGHTSAKMKRAPTFNDFKPLVHRRQLVLSAVDVYNANPAAVKDWLTLDRQTGVRTTWQHCLLTPKREQAPVVPTQQAAAVQPIPHAKQTGTATAGATTTTYTF